jgi:transposase
MLDIYRWVWYYTTMATITPRVIKGRTYYYAVKCGRVNGKPRLVWQKYLGTADDIIRCCSKGGQPIRPKTVRLFRFGAEAAQLHIAQRLGIAEIIDNFIPKRNQGITVGEYLLIAAINRGCHPKSKRSIADWFFKSMLAHRFPGVKACELTSQRFWDHMDMVRVDAIPMIEEAITRRVIKLYDIDLRTLIYDTTNFFTYIDTFNRRCKIALRGKNKQKRFDLRQVNLALLVSRDYHIPLFHQCYEGNTVDSKSFQSVVDELVERLKVVAEGCEEVTVVFDKGNNSEVAIGKLDRSKYHFVGSLVPSHFKDLLEVSDDKYHSLEDERFDRMRVYRQQCEVFGAKRTVVVVFSPDFFTKQLKTVLLMVEKAQSKLKVLQDRFKMWQKGIFRKGRVPTVQSVKKQVAEILKGQHMKNLIKVSVKQKGKIPVLSFNLDVKHLDGLTKTLFGKTILFTDNHDWSNEEIIRAFWDKGDVEEAFRRMKDRDYSSWFPMFHWTDQKIKVHAFYCVLALLFTSLLYREANRAGINISQMKLMEKLKEIHQVLHIYPSQGKGRKSPHPQMILSERDKTQQKLCNLFQLEKFQ